MPADGRLEPADGRLEPADGRLEPAASFNALFTHRVRVPGLEAIDAELTGWLRHAYDRAG